MEDLQNKDVSIVEIYNNLEKKLGKNHFQLVDFWESDLFAIGIKKGNKLVYISTWGVDNKTEELHLYADFELIDPITNDTIEVVKQFSDISLDDFIIQVCIFFS